METYEIGSFNRPSTEDDSDEIHDECLPPKKRKSTQDHGNKRKLFAGTQLGSASYSSNLSASDTEESQEDETSADEQKFSDFSDKAKKMMMTMGYEKGKGLGRYKQGIVAPIPASNQRGRRGLGFIIEGLEPKENLVWDKSKEHISVEEEVRWIPHSDIPLPIVETLMTWPNLGPQLKDIKDQTDFCHPKILEKILESKSIFDELPDKELYRARSRCNPFETIGKLFFQNRAALKMANLDSVFDFMFTQPISDNGKSLVSPHELLYFADVCAAPGGFSEYVLWKKKDISNGFCDAKGFGFTLKANDFKLDDFFAAPSEFFEPHYGESGTQGNGDVYDPDNITNFRNFVLKTTDSKGVHFMMADGGFSVEGEENIQEILSKQLYMCQFIVALGIVRTNGHFVCKLFDIFTPFSIGLVYIMSKCFKKVAIHKPNTSRPANSERYIVCKWKNSDASKNAYEYLFDLNLQLREIKSTTSDEDILEVVPVDVMAEDKDFCRYIYESNNILGGRQIVSLQKIRAYCQDLKLIEDLQAIMRKDSLSYWKLPDKTRLAPPHRMDPKLKIGELLHKEILDKLGDVPIDLTPQNLGEVVRSLYDFRFVFLASNKEAVKERGFFVGMGGPNVYLWNGKSIRGIHRVDAVIHLPPDTIFYGELLIELKGELKAQRKVRVLHMIDALVLNGFNVSNVHLVERHNYLRKFAHAINKESRNDLISIRCKPLYKFEELESVICEPLITWRILKSGNGIHRRVYRESEALEGTPARYTIPTGIMLLKMTKDPWMMAYSKSQQRKYWFNTQTRDSTFDCFPGGISDVSETYSRGAHWWWNPGVELSESDVGDPECLHLKTLIKYVHDNK